MVLRWEGGPPPDGQEWVDVLSRALGQESGFYWVRFYRQPGGWRFDLERRSEPGPEGGSGYRRADESVLHRAFTALAESGKRLDPSWSPPVASPPGVVVRMPGPAAHPADAAAPANPPRTVLETPSPVPHTRTRPASVAHPAARPQPQLLVPPAPSARPRSAGRRVLRFVLVTTPVLLLAVVAWWFFRDSLPWPAGLPAIAWPLASPSEPAPTAPEKPEGIARPSSESARPSPESARPSPESARPSPESAAPSPESGQPPASQLQPLPGAAGNTQRETAQRPAQRSRRGVDESRPPAPALAPRPASAPTPRPATPAPLARRGDVAEVDDPGLTPPAVVSQSCPSYPPVALERRLSGTVSLTAVVDETGAVVEVSRVRASPQGVGFEEAATKCVLSRVYRPATRHDAPVRVRVPIRIEFQPPVR
jgi:TonB family protein